MTDTSFNCNVNRTTGDPSTEMYLINHFLDKEVLGLPAPDPQDANTTNAASGVGSLGQQVSTCASQNGRYPNFMLLDVSWPQLFLELTTDDSLICTLSSMSSLGPRHSRSPRKQTVLHSMLPRLSRLLVNLRLVPEVHRLQASRLPTSTLLSA